MRKLWWATIIAVVAVVAVAAGAVLEQFNMPGKATVASFIEVRVEGQVWVNGTTLDWGTVYPGGEYKKNLTVTNTSTQNVTVGLYITNLPTGLTETWLGNNTELEPDTAVTGDLTLTVAAGASPATYTWDRTITAEETVT